MELFNQWGGWKHGTSHREDRPVACARMTRKFVKRSIFFFSFIISVDITSIISRLLIITEIGLSGM